MEKIKDAIADFQAKNDEYLKMSKAVRDAAERLIKELIEKNGGEIDRKGKLLYGVSVSYDGGNHPEYANCIFSDVMRVYLKDDQIFLDIKYEPDYCLDRVPTEDVIWMCDDIINNL